MATRPMNRSPWTSEFRRPLRICKTREVYPQPTIQQMRELINLYAWDDPATHAILHAAQWRGYTEQETMIFLAFQALCQAEASRDMFADHLLYCNRPVIITDKSKVTDGTK